LQNFSGSFAHNLGRPAKEVVAMAFGIIPARSMPGEDVFGGTPALPFPGQHGVNWSFINENIIVNMCSGQPLFERFF
jgi:hypothetical protein